jgi:hypothetical protein
VGLAVPPRNRHYDCTRKISSIKQKLPSIQGAGIVSLALGPIKQHAGAARAWQGPSGATHITPARNRCLQPQLLPPLHTAGRYLVQRRGTAPCADLQPHHPPQQRGCARRGQRARQGARQAALAPNLSAMGSTGFRPAAPPVAAPGPNPKPQRRLQVDRVAKSGGPLYRNFTSGQALSYLDGSLPGGACQQKHAPSAGDRCDSLSHTRGLSMHVPSSFAVHRRCNAVVVA